MNDKLIFLLKSWLNTVEPLNYPNLFKEDIKQTNDKSFDVRHELTVFYHLKMN